jgi:hypothetical protein
MRTQVEQRFENGDPVREYWLARGEGFAVETQRGRTVGRVVDVVLDAEEGRIGQIVVRTRGFRSIRGRTAEIPSGEVAAAVPARKAFVLDGQPASPARVRRAARRGLRRVAAAAGRAGFAVTRALGIGVVLGARYAWELARVLALSIRHQWALARARR